MVSERGLFVSELGHLLLTPSKVVNSGLEIPLLRPPESGMHSATDEGSDTNEEAVGDSIPYWRHTLDSSIVLEDREMIKNSIDRLSSGMENLLKDFPELNEADSDSFYGVAIELQKAAPIGVLLCRKALLHCIHGPKERALAMANCAHSLMVRNPYIQGDIDYFRKQSISHTMAAALTNLSLLPSLVLCLAFQANDRWEEALHLLEPLLNLPFWRAHLREQRAFVSEIFISHVRLCGLCNRLGQMEKAIQLARQLPCEAGVLRIMRAEFLVLSSIQRNDSKKECDSAPKLFSTRSLRDALTDIRDCLSAQTKHAAAEVLHLWLCHIVEDGNITVKGSGSTQKAVPSRVEDVLHQTIYDPGHSTAWPKHALEALGGLALLINRPKWAVKVTAEMGEGVVYSLARVWWAAEQRQLPEAMSNLKSLTFQSSSSLSKSSNVTAITSVPETESSRSSTSLETWQRALAYANTGDLRIAGNEIDKSFHGAVFLYLQALKFISSDESNEKCVALCREAVKVLSFLGEETLRSRVILRMSLFSASSVLDDSRVDTSCSSQAVAFDSWRTMVDAMRSERHSDAIACGLQALQVLDCLNLYEAAYIYEGLSYLYGKSATVISKDVSKMVADYSQQARQSFQIVESLHNHALRLLDGGMNQAAMETVQAALQQLEQLPNGKGSRIAKCLLTTLGVAQVKLRLWAAAEASFSTAATGLYRNGEACYNLAWLWMQGHGALVGEVSPLNSYQRCIEMLDDCLALLPAHYRAYNNRAVMHERMQYLLQQEWTAMLEAEADMDIEVVEKKEVAMRYHSQQAVANYSDALLWNSESVVALQNRCLYQLQSRNPAAALDDWKALSAMSSGASMSWLQQVQAVLGRFTITLALVADDFVHVIRFFLNAAGQNEAARSLQANSLEPSWDHSFLLPLLPLQLSEILENSSSSVSNPTVLENLVAMRDALLEVQYAYDNDALATADAMLTLAEYPALQCKLHTLRDDILASIYFHRVRVRSLLAQWPAALQAALEAATRRLHSRRFRAAFFCIAANLQWGMRNIKDALRSYQSAQLADPTYWYATLNLGGLSHRQGQIGDALKWYVDTATILFPSWAQSVVVALKQYLKGVNSSAFYEVSNLYRWQGALAMAMERISERNDGIQDAFGEYVASRVQKREFLALSQQLGDKISQMGQNMDSLLQEREIDMLTTKLFSNIATSL